MAVHIDVWNALCSRCRGRACHRMQCDGSETERHSKSRDANNHFQWVCRRIQDGDCATDVWPAVVPQSTTSFPMKKPLWMRDWRPSHAPHCSESGILQSLHTVSVQKEDYASKITGNSFSSPKPIQRIFCSSFVCRIGGGY